MLKLLKKILIIAVFIFALDFSIGLVLRHFYFAQKMGTAHHITQCIEKTKADILIFGTSRAQHSYNPEIFEKSLGKSCYNVGQAGLNIFFTLAIQRCVLKRYTPEIMILEVFPIDLLAESKEEYNRLSYLLPYYSKHDELRDIINLRSPYEKFKMLSGIYPYNSLLLPLIYNNVFEMNYKYQKGYIPLEQTMNAAQKEKMNYKEIKIDQNQLSAFESFITNARNAGCQLYVAISPLYTEANAAYATGLQTTLAVLAKHKIKLWDYSADPRFNDVQFFKDPIHINDKGAQTYSAIVADRIKTEFAYVKN